MLNSPLGGTAAGNAFYLKVQRRVQASRESRRILNEVLMEMDKQRRKSEPDYAEIVRQINICIAEITPQGRPRPDAVDHPYRGD